jgi:UDP-N-acetylmuramate: L-alanyl-gamma-D-glutamyl-meso-diaminopimelate ligase
MHIHFLGIGGTLMGHLALLARELGHEVSGSDQGIYPPMSDVLAAAGIDAAEGFTPALFTPPPDLVVIGNAGLPRGHPAVEYVLDQGIPHTSGAQWLGEHVLARRWVLAVSGTHGKTTTTAMLAWILEHAGLAPGYLIGGVPANFAVSARLGTQPFFVVEADEYDTSYFDRRSKFVHYRPRTLVINNLEYDHADIFPDLAAIQTQFHHLLRAVPASGLVIVPSEDEAIDEVIERGCWTPVERVAAVRRASRHRGRPDATWRAAGVARDGGAFDVQIEGHGAGRVSWPLIGTHNVHNALMAIAAARHAGVSPATAMEALEGFRGVRRRLERLGHRGDVEYYDDFAHHPTAIRATLQALRDHVGPDEIIAVVEPRSHTMSLGTLRDDLATCCAPADRAIWFRGANINWDLQGMVAASVIPARIEDNLDELARELLALDRKPVADGRSRGRPRQRRHVVLMSNGSFGGLAGRLRAALAG